MTARARIRMLVMLCGLVALAAVIPAVTSGYWLKVLTLSAVFMLPALAVNVLYGRLGFVSLSQLAFVGVGGWVFLRIGHATALPNPVLLLCAGVITCVVGTLVGLPALRLSGLTLSLVTLMTAAAFEVVIAAVGFPDGGPGFFGSDTPSPSTVPRPPFATSDVGVFLYTVIVVAALFVATAALTRGRTGRAWAVIRQSPAAAYAAGIDVARYRVIGLALTSFISGVSGGLLATGDGRLDPISFPALQSVVLFAVLLIGGAFSLWGAVLAGLLYEALPNALSQAGVNSDIILVVIGLGLINSLTTAPGGMAAQLAGLPAAIRRVARRLSARDTDVAAMPGTGGPS
jgi:branched-chain amino acid transport system permease protein